jgi:hypothetical protein
VKREFTRVQVMNGRCAHCNSQTIEQVLVLSFLELCLMNIE